MAKSENLNNQQSDRASDFVHRLTADQHRIYAFILTLVPNWFDAEDLMQETVEVMWRKFQDSDQINNFCAWGKGMARNKIMNFYAKKRRERVLFDDSYAAAPYQPYAENQFTLEQRKEGIRRGELYPIVKNVAAYHCPSDRSKGGNYRSYSMPDSLNGKWGTNNWGKAQWMNMKKIDEISNPSNAYVFVEENDPRGYNVSSWVLNATNPDAWGDPVAVWHDARSSFGFADGHAETWKWSIETLKMFDEYSSMGIKPSPKGDGVQDLQRIRSSWPHKKGQRLLDK
jgi:prepilin-type processing-associated H-X9-DG protein